MDCLILKFNIFALFCFVIFWSCWVFVTCGLFPSCIEWGLLSSCGAQASDCSGFSCGAQALGCTGFSSCGSQVLLYRLNSCGSWDYLLCSIRDLPRSGIELISPALAGRFFITELPGKTTILNMAFINLCNQTYLFLKFTSCQFSPGSSGSQFTI